VGFQFEPFDTIGDYRTIDDYGQPVDLTNITIVGASDPALNVPTAGPVALAQNLAGSDAPNQCLAEQMYIYMTHRGDATADYPVESQVAGIFDNAKQSVAPMLVGLTQTQVFLNRVNVQ